MILLSIFSLSFSLLKFQTHKKSPSTQIKSIVELLCWMMKPNVLHLVVVRDFMIMYMSSSSAAWYVLYADYIKSYYVGWWNFKWKENFLINPTSESVEEKCTLWFALFKRVAYCAERKVNQVDNLMVIRLQCADYEQNCFMFHICIGALQLRDVNNEKVVTL